VAVSKETPVMTSEWIEAVWERGKLDNIHATDPQFARFGFRLSLESFTPTSVLFNS
jgi:hypothetical protein